MSAEAAALLAVLESALKALDTGGPAAAAVVLHAQGRAAVSKARGED